MPFTPARRVAILLIAACCVVAAGLTAGAAGSDNTWTPTGAFAEKPSSPIFALAVDPADGRRMLVGTASGTIYLSSDGGASWKPVRKGSGHAVLALAFDPARAGTLFAGTRGEGILHSADGGLSWQPQPGGEAGTVRAFAFVNGAALAASDDGVLRSRDGGPWSGAGLAQVRVSALAALPASGAAAGGTVVAGGDATRGTEPLPLFSSADGGQHWSAVPVTGPGGVVGGSATVAALAGGPAAGPAARGLLMGTNTGLFMSRDGGASWQQLTGGGAVPATDVTSLVVAPRRADRLYVASDGGGSANGGLWVSSDGGGHLASLAPPLPEVTAVAVTSDAQPTVVVATFQPAEHAVAVWTYHDAGGKPQGPAALPPGTAPAARGASRAAASSFGWLALFARPETPYLALGVAALAVVVLAAVAYVRRGRQM